MAAKQYEHGTKQNYRANCSNSTQEKFNYQPGGKLRSIEECPR